MYIDSRKLAPNRIVEADICIVGAGPAGITLALEFAKKPFSVCLLESGGLVYDPETDSLSKGITIGRNYDLVNTRNRIFGGTTNTWGGHCVPIRPLNFEKRDWIPYSGWPIGRSDLDLYYKRADAVHKVGEFAYDAKAIADGIGLKLFPFDSKNVESVVSKYNAMSFGVEYKDSIGSAHNINTYLYANATSINRHPDAGFVRDISVKTLAGNSFSVRAKQYVLAAGGIENARLLLLSKNVQKKGLGNDYDLVGRFFMEHVWYPSGLILPVDQDSLYKIYTSEQHYREACRIRCHIALPEEVEREQAITDFRSEIGLEKTPPESVVSARILRDKANKFEIPDHLSQHMVNILLDPGAIIDHLGGKKRSLHAYRLYNYIEQVPNPESRVFLSDEKDKLGLNKVVLDWRLSKIDKTAVQKAHRLIAAEVGRRHFGRMRIEMPEDEAFLFEGYAGGCHHMGTTRMHDNPRHGVVDANCRIHGLKNIYIAGSSVFPTCGYSNPTLTIVALAIRLADHLGRNMEKEGRT